MKGDSGINVNQIDCGKKKNDRFNIIQISFD